MTTNYLRIEFLDLGHQSRAQSLAQPFILDPLHDHPSGPAELILETVEQAAAAAKQVLGAAGQELGQRLDRSSDGDRIVGKDVVVQKELDVNVELFIPRGKPAGDGRAPLLLPSHVRAVIANSMLGNYAEYKGTADDLSVGDYNVIIK